MSTDVSNIAKSRRNRARSNLSGAARFRRWWVPYLWLVIPVLVVITFYLYPFFNTFRLSLTDAKPLTGQGNFVGLNNFVTIFSDPRFWNATLNSVVYALIVVPSLTLLPLLLAVLVKKHVPGIGLFRSLYYLPAVSSLVVISLAWSSILRGNGVLNNFLVNTGLIDNPVPFLTGRWWLIISACLITVWSGLPYYMIMYLAALANVDRSLYEAAEMDGAGAVSQFFHITIPGVRLMMALVATLTTIGSLKIFTEVHLLSNGTGGIGQQSETLTMYIRRIGISDPTYGSLGLGSAAAVALFVLTLGFIIIQQIINRKEA
ncbi:MAG: sugar ABC transporter permease [Propionibacteriaceae bacterium]|nr:sugar ABC transporter permease [Propionibacteriaceae bacterium]